MGANTSCNSKILYIWLSVILLLPLCWIKHMKHLAYLSLVVLVGMVFTYITILAICGELLYQGNHHMEEIKYFDLLNYPFFFGIALLNFEGNPTSLNVRHAMKKRSKFNFAFIVSAIFVCTFTISVAVVGYLTFGPYTADIILLSLPDGYLVLVIRLVYCVCLWGTYPIQMYATIDIIENFDWYNNMPNLESFDLRYYGVRTLYVILTGVIACIIPKFGLFMNFFGALSGTAL